MSDRGSDRRKDQGDMKNTKPTDKGKKRTIIPSWLRPSEQPASEQGKPQSSITDSSLNRLRATFPSLNALFSQRNPDSSVPQELGSRGGEFRRVTVTEDQVKALLQAGFKLTPLEEFRKNDSEIRTREGIEDTVPENFHNRPLLETIADARNCAIDAIAISSNPDLKIEDRKAIIANVRSIMEGQGFVEKDDQIDVNNMIEGNMPLGKILLETMSMMTYIRENCGLTVHHSHYQDIMGDHTQVVPGNDPIHIYLENCQPVQHFWGMGPEIVPEAWAPDTDVFPG